MSASSAARAASAAVGNGCTPGACLRYVRTWEGAPGGFPTAIVAWTRARTKHRGDYEAPAGVPCFFAPNHVAMSIGGGRIVSTDWPSSGVIGQTTISTLERTWHHPYLGWTEDVDGMRITGIPAPSTTPRPAPSGADQSGGGASPTYPGAGVEAAGLGGLVTGWGTADVERFLLTGLALVAGVGLVAMGAAKITKPARDAVEETAGKVTDDVSKAAALAAL